MTTATHSNTSTSALPLTGQVALVTGASRGIGAAIASQLASQGATVIGTATTASGAAAIQAALSPFAGSTGAVLDVNDGTAVLQQIDAIVSAHGQLTILVNNAGITRDTLAMRMKDDDWDAVTNTNLKAVFTVSRAAIKPMMKQRFGRIINITSVVGAMGNAGQANYAAAKAGVAGMTRALARELGSRNITVNCVAPGFIDAGMSAPIFLDDKVRAKRSGGVPLKRLGTAEDVVQAVLFLASDASGYIHGHELVVDGGVIQSVLAHLPRS